MPSQIRLSRNFYANLAQMHACTLEVERGVWVENAPGTVITIKLLFGDKCRIALAHYTGNSCGIITKGRGVVLVEATKNRISHAFAPLNSYPNKQLNLLRTIEAYAKRLTIEN